MTVEELLEALDVVPDKYIVWIISDFGEGELTPEMLHVNKREGWFVIDTAGTPSPGAMSLDDWIDAQ